MSSLMPAIKPAYFLILVSLFNHAAYSGARMAIPLYAVSLGASPAVIGLQLALFGFLGIFTSVHLGRWVDRHGARIPYLLASIGVGVGVFLPVVWQQLGALFLVCLLAGTAWNACYLANVQLMGQLGTPTEKIGNFSMHSTLLSVSSLIAPLITGLLIDHAGFSVSFATLGLLPLVTIAMILLDRMPFPPADAARASRPPATDTTPADTSERKRSIFQLLRVRALRHAYVVGMLVQGIWNVYFFLMPLHGAYIGLSASQIGALLALFAFSSICSRPILVRMRRRCSAWQIVTINMVMMAIALAGVPCFDTLGPQLVFAVILGLALGLGSPVSLALLHEASPPGRAGEAAGLRTTILAVVQTAAPLLAGLTGATTGLHSAFVFLAVCAALGGWLSYFLMRTEK